MLMPEVIAELRRLEAAAKQEIQSGKLGRVAWVDWTCALQDNSDALLSAAGEAQELASEHDKVLEYARKAAGTRDVHSVYEVLDLVEGLREERERQNAFLNGILVGGNHLASALIHWLGAGDDTFPPYQTEIHEAREIIADPLHWDAWVCWRSIMLARDAARSEEHPRRHQRGETMSDYRKRLEAAVRTCSRAFMNAEVSP